MKHSIILTIGVLLALPAVADAQRWGRERFPDSGACFFQDVDYRGDYFCVRAGEDVRAVPDGMNDKISSIRIIGRAEVVIFRDVRFAGTSLRLKSSARDLRRENWNDWLSSLRVESQGRDSRFGDLQNEQRGRDRRGEDPDKIVRRAYQDLLGREPDPGGLSVYRKRIVDDGWSEEQVRNAIKAGPEYREKNTLTSAKAQQMVRAAYLAVLKREPDPGGWQSYVNLVLRNNWSQQDVENELRKSPEFRGR